MARFVRINGFRWKDDELKFEEVHGPPASAVVIVMVTLLSSPALSEA